MDVPARSDLPDLNRYYADTISSLEKMRNPESGWVRDKILVLPGKNGGYRLRILNENTSPTNIGLDLINQLALIENGLDHGAAQENIERALQSLERARHDEKTGLFFSWYSTGKDLRPAQLDVSSVDNIHLALALWTMAQSYPKAPVRNTAARLLRRMDFSEFYDAKSGLMGGNLKHHHGKWELENYRFANLGSEARSIYSIGWALGLFRKDLDPDFAPRAIAAMKAEVYRWKSLAGEKPILKTWDGGAFQLLLPKLLANEENYSPWMKRNFKNYGEYVLAETERQKLAAPAAHSASNYGTDDGYAFGKIPSYHGKAGSPDLVSSDHAEIRDPQELAKWDLTYTPHALFMAATTDSSKLAPAIIASEKLRSGSNRLYRTGLGFMDGYHVKGLYRGQVVPVQLSLDQGMIALSLSQMLSADHMSPSARALAKNPLTRKRLAEFYRILDEKLVRENGSGR